MLLRRRLLELILVISAVWMSACGRENSDAIRFGLSTAPVTLDPRYATDAVSQRINRLIYQRLVDFDEHYQMVPALADWEILAADHYRFRLNTPVRQFHDGSRLTAADVKATYDNILDPDTVSPHRATLMNIRNIEIIDDNIVDFHLRNPDPLFPGRLAIGIMPAKLISTGHAFNQLPVGSGKARFTRWPQEDYLVLQRIDDGQMLEFLTVKDSTVRVLKLLNNEIDLIQNDLPFEMLDWLRNKPEIVIETAKGSTFTYLGFNLKDPDLQRPEIRQAIAYALDRESIIHFVLGGAARKAGALLPPDHWAGHPELSGYDYDPEMARRLLQQAGYDKTRPLRMTYKTSNNPLRVRLATVIQYQLKQIGMEVQVQSYDWGTFYGDIKSGRFQMFSLSWVGLNLPDIFHYVFHSTSIPPAGANRGYFNDPIADELIDNAASLGTVEAQATAWHKLQEYLHEQLPYVPLWYEDNILARQRNINGYVISHNGDFDGLLNTQKTVISE